jgi:hypothetical protein
MKQSFRHIALLFTSSAGSSTIVSASSSADIALIQINKSTMTTKTVSTKNCCLIKSSGMAAALLILLLSSCQKENLSRIGFNCDFSASSSGVTMMTVEKNVRSLTLAGNICLDTGGVSVEVISPSGQVMYKTDLYDSGLFTINESIQGENGIWTLLYKSNGGLGHMRVHLINTLSIY